MPYVAIVNSGFMRSGIEWNQLYKQTWRSQRPRYQRDYIS